MSIDLRMEHLEQSDCHLSRCREPGYTPVQSYKTDVPGVQPLSVRSFVSQPLDRAVASN